MKRAFMLMLFCGGCFAQDGTAKVTVFREKHLIGSMIKPSIYYDGTELQRMENGAYFVANVPAGKHMITAGRSEVGLLIDFEPGKEYFFKFDHRNWAGNAVSGRAPVFLVQVSKEEAVAEIKKIKKETSK